MIITADLLFSYWLVAWFFIYIIFRNYSETVHQYFNPLLVFIVAAIINLLLSIFIFVKVGSSVFLFIVANIIIKLIPIIFLIGEPVHYGLHLVIGMAVFIVYNLYLYFVKNTDILKIFIATEDSIVNGKNNTPMLHLFNTHPFNTFNKMLQSS